MVAGGVVGWARLMVWWDGLGWFSFIVFGIVLWDGAALGQARFLPRFRLQVVELVLQAAIGKEGAVDEAGVPVELDNCLGNRWHDAFVVVVWWV